jgi:copper chaperone CopZ
MELSELEGIDSIQVDVDKKEIAVTYEQPASEQKIRDLLIEINYPPEK